MLVLNRMSRSLQGLERYAIEIVLSLSEMWIAWRLLMPPPKFDNAPNFAFVAELATEPQWACLALLAAGLKIGGLVLTATKRRPEAAIALRLAGISLSGTFWVSMGFSAVISNAQSLFGMPVLLLGVSAWWLLLRFPTIPKG